MVCILIKPTKRNKNDFPLEEVHYAYSGSGPVDRFDDDDDLNENIKKAEGKILVKKDDILRDCKFKGFAFGFGSGIIGGLIVFFETLHYCIFVAFISFFVIYIVCGIIGNIVGRIFARFAPNYYYEKFLRNSIPTIM